MVREDAEAFFGPLPVGEVARDDHGTGHFPGAVVRQAAVGLHLEPVPTGMLEVELQSPHFRLRLQRLDHTGDVIRVNQLERADADQLLGLVPQDRPVRGVDEREPVVRVRQADQIRRGRNDHFESVVRRLMGGGGGYKVQSPLRGRLGRGHSASRSAD